MPPTFIVTSRIVFASCILVYSCTNKDSNNKIINALDESIIESNKTISGYTDLNMYSLEDKLTDPRTVEKARYWYARAQQVSYLSDTLFAYINDIKKQEYQQPGFLSKNNGALYKNLMQYQKEVLETDREFAQAFTNIVVTTEAFDSVNHTEKDFSHTFFENISPTSTIAILNKFQNNVRVIENQMITFCNNKVGITWDGYWSYLPIVVMSSTYVQPGEKIEIIAGIGSFSKAALPEITINRKNIQLNESGYASYKIKSSNKPGKYYTPVKISYTDQDGNKQTIEKHVEYTVAGEAVK